MNSFTTLLDEKEVLDRLKNGDEEAFTQIYNHYWKPSFYRAVARLENLLEAEELVQDIFLDIWKRREHLSITSGLSSYLAVSLKYRIINALARQNRHRQYQQYNLRHTVVTNSTTEAVFDFETLKEQLEKETAKLPGKCQLVFRLSRENGYSHKEIAAKLQISEKTVETHLTKAIRQLKTGLSHILSAYLLLILG